MADIMDYMEWRGDVTFDMIPVNEVDGLIFSQFAYIPLEGIVKPGTDLSTLQGQIEFKPPGISAAGNHIVGQSSVFSRQP